MLGWNAGTEQEIFSLEELVEQFSIGRVHKAGAKFDYEKAKWFNHEWIKHFPLEKLIDKVRALYLEKNIDCPEDKLTSIVALMKDRAVLLEDFISQASYFFRAPANFDMDSVRPKWNEEKRAFFEELSAGLPKLEVWDEPNLELFFKERAAAHSIKPGELQMIFRIILVGNKTGPAVFAIAGILGAVETSARIDLFLSQLS